MPIVTKDQALERMTREVREGLPPDELLEVYNEVFRDDRQTEAALADPEPLITRLTDRINRLDVAELADYWGLIFIGHRDIWYDEEDERLHYTEQSTALPAE
jgi:hypothetical protein